MSPFRCEDKRVAGPERTSVVSILVLVASYGPHKEWQSCRNVVRDSMSVTRELRSSESVPQPLLLHDLQACV